MKQKIYTDPYGVESWDTEKRSRVFVHIVNSLAFREITGFDAPGSPIDAHTYTQFGFPWFDLYDENKQTISGTDSLTSVKSVAELDSKKGADPDPVNAGFDVPQKQVTMIDPTGSLVKDGTW